MIVRIRTKLVLSLLIITLLPVLPVYFLVKGLLQRSLEIGFNENVELALENATEISKELYAKYKNETLSLAEELASSDWVLQAMEKQIAPAPMFTEKAELLGKVKIDLFNTKGNLIYSGSNSPEGRRIFIQRPEREFPKLYQNIIMPLTRKQEAGVLDIASNPSYISAFAPIIGNGVQLGLLVVTKAVDENFSRGSQQVVKVHQMFKTLSFFEQDLTKGFLLSFFAVYAPIAALSVVLAYYFSRKMTKPLLMLVDGTKKVAAGNWDYRVEGTSRDEVGELVKAFNKMISTLKEKQDQVIALEKMAVWREIARILAHEIKNPLTPIQLTVQQMKDQYQGNDPQYRRLLEECTEIVSDEIESLRTLVREFSEFARLPKLNLIRGNLNDLIEEVSKLYTDIDINLELASSLPRFDFDYEKMRRVFINLIENSIDSIKSKGQGRIIVKTRQQGKEVQIQVSDTGSGIASELKEKIFEPYFSTKKSGVGLGLAIVKRIVEEHGGKISLESRVGEGSTFIIMLPILGN